MTVVIVFIGIIVALNCIPYFIKADFPKAEKAIIKMLAVSKLLFLALTLFKTSG